ATLFVQTSFEVGLCSFGVLRPWFLLVIALCNGWGMLDAFFRFPLVHDLDSFFGLKQVLLITVKMAGYSLGFHDISRFVGWFVLLILCNVFTLPILWLTALPIGDVASYHQKHDVVDEDLLLRLWRMTSSPTGRASVVARCKASVRQVSLNAVEAMPFLKPVAVRLDPSLARMMGSHRAV
ncbi:unnamed protein product, partial [Polarella glacialis]